MTIQKGGGYLLGFQQVKEVFTPEDFTEEQKMIANMTADFVQGEVMPKDEEIEKQNLDIMVALLKQAGELGLLGAEVPVEYEGSDLDKISATLITENMVRGSSFALSHGAHVGIGSLPIVLFGTKEQKEKYLPDLATGRKIAAYCLTEPSSGSDALGAKTTARLSDDGDHYILNGTKQYITNAGFADVFIVYAKVDGVHFSAFIVERSFEGLTTGPEEKKMGIKGSSTRPLILEDVKVPRANLLGEVGKGHVIAFNILNIGRYKLAAGCVGTSKWAIELSIQYAKERKQFNQALIKFPLIQKKLAEMAIQTFATESIVYRTGGLIQDSLSRLDKSSDLYNRDVAKAIEEYAIECSINKVFASESLNFVADEGVQIHGGYGYTQDYMIERIYRDARINRIFEGTNEINRLLIPGTLLRRALKGDLPFLTSAKELQKELISYLPPSIHEAVSLEKEEAMLQAAKKIFLLCGGTAVQKHKENLEYEQEILELLANQMIEIFAMDSVYLRTKKAMERSDSSKWEQKKDMASVFIHTSFSNVEKYGKLLLGSISEGDTLKTQLAILKKLVRFEPFDEIPVKRKIAKRIISVGKYLA